MLGIGEMIFVASIIVIVFGARKIPALGSALGSSVRYFKNGLKGKEDTRPSRDVGEIAPPGARLRGERT